MSKLNAFVGASYVAAGRCPSCGSNNSLAPRWKVQRNAFLVEYRGDKNKARVCALCAAIIDLDKVEPKQFLGAGI